MIKKKLRSIDILVFTRINAACKNPILSNWSKKVEIKLNDCRQRTLGTKKPRGFVH